MSEENRAKSVQKFTDNLADKLDHKKWENASCSVVGKLPFQEFISQAFVDLYRHVQKGRSCKNKHCNKIFRSVIKDNNDLEVYKLLLQLINITDIEENILPDVYDDTCDEDIDTCKREILQAILGFISIKLKDIGNIDSKKEQGLLKKMGDIVTPILDKAEVIAYKNFLENIKDDSFIVDTYSINLVSNRLNRNILFFDSATKLPVAPFDTSKIHRKNRKYVIVLRIKDKDHYEVLGKLLPGGKKVQREFSADEGIIKKINLFTTSPKKFAQKYPELAALITIPLGGSDEAKNSKENNDSDNSDDDSDDDSDDSTSSTSSAELKLRKSKAKKSPRKLGGSEPSSQDSSEDESDGESDGESDSSSSTSQSDKEEPGSRVNKNKNNRRKLSRRMAHKPDRKHIPPPRSPEKAQQKPQKNQKSHNPEKPSVSSSLQVPHGLVDKLKAM